jgi:hypothetical protein
VLDVVLRPVDAGLHIDGGVEGFGFVPSGVGAALCVERRDAQGIREVECMLARMFTVDADGLGDFGCGLVVQAKLRVDVCGVAKRIGNEKRIIAMARQGEGIGGPVRCAAAAFLSFALIICMTVS